MYKEAILKARNNKRDLLIVSNTDSGKTTMAVQLVEELNIEGYGTIGRNKVKIPSKYYKVIYAPEKNIMIGFVMTNAKLSGQLSSYAISVDRIEAITGIDFFSQLPDNIENDLESKVNLSDWDFSLSSSASYSSSKSVLTQFRGIAKSSGSRYRNKITNENGYCHLHQNQTNNYVVPSFINEKYRTR